MRWRIQVITRNLTALALALASGASYGAAVFWSGDPVERFTQEKRR